jgi:hypothetical protein
VLTVGNDIGGRHELAVAPVSGMVGLRSPANPAGRMIAPVIGSKVRGCEMLAGHPVVLVASKP